MLATRHILLQAEAELSRGGQVRVSLTPVDAEVTQIMQGWTNVRREWFRVVRQQIFENSETAAHVNQDGKAELAMRAYQLIDAISYVGSNGYLPESLLPQLFEKMSVMLSNSEEQYAEILGYSNRYRAVIANHGEFLRFAADIAAHCFGDEFTAKSFEVMAFIPLFLGHSRWVVSKAFNDEPQMRKIKEWLELHKC